MQRLRLARLSTEEEVRIHRVSHLPFVIGARNALQDVGGIGPTEPVVSRREAGME